MQKRTRSSWANTSSSSSRIQTTLLRCTRLHAVTVQSQPKPTQLTASPLPTMPPYLTQMSKCISPIVQYNNHSLRHPQKSQLCSFPSARSVRPTLIYNLLHAITHPKQGRCLCVKNQHLNKFSLGDTAFTRIFSKFFEKISQNLEKFFLKILWLG